MSHFSVNVEYKAIDHTSCVTNVDYTSSRGIDFCCAIVYDYVLWQPKSNSYYFQPSDP